MGQKKLQRFAEIKTFSNVLEHPQDMPGKWSGFFGNNHPLILELACGKGEYAVGLGRKFKDRNFIGIDIKGNRIWRGAKTALEENLKNVAFLRSPIDNIDRYFAPGEVSELWITFPDPQLKLSKIKKRLTHPKFLRLYQQFLQPGGIVHLKTDSPDLYRFTKAVIDLYHLDLQEDRDDVYSAEDISDELRIKTYYESLDIAGSNRVHYLKFNIDKPLPAEKDILLKDLFREQAAD